MRIVSSILPNLRNSFWQEHICLFKAFGKNSKKQTDRPNEVCWSCETSRWHRICGVTNRNVTGRDDLANFFVAF